MEKLLQSNLYKWHRIKKPPQKLLLHFSLLITQDYNKTLTVGTMQIGKEKYIVQKRTTLEVFKYIIYKNKVQLLGLQYIQHL